MEQLAGSVYIGDTSGKQVAVKQLKCYSPHLTRSNGFLFSQNASYLPFVVGRLRIT